MKKLEQLKNYLLTTLEAKVDVKNIELFGYQYKYNKDIIKSVSKYWFKEHTIEEMIAPLNTESENDNRPGTIKESTQYVVVHDTASSAPTANEYAHARYVTNGGGGTSWHYSVGDNASIHQIPDNEVAYHAGDGLAVRFELLKTGVYGTNKNPSIELKHGYYYIDNQKSNIPTPVVTFVNNGEKLVYASDGILMGTKAPEGAKEGDVYEVSTKDINDAGLRIDLIDGEYYMAPTYFNSTYKKIANRGGNRNSIGIETMINEGSNPIRTWHRCAKLVAHLLIDNNLDVTRVKPHHFFSGKDCPMTLRRNNLYGYFMDCVYAEYEILTKYSDVEITLKPLSTGLNEEGLIELENVQNEVKYLIILKKDNKTLEFEYTTQVQK